MSLGAVADAVASALLVAGALLCLTAGLGLVRFPDVFARMHAGTKPQVLGVLLVMAGAALRLDGVATAWMLLLVAAFQLLTVPVSAHLVSRVAYRRGHADRALLVVDELRADGGQLGAGGGERGAAGAGPADTHGG